MSTTNDIPELPAPKEITWDTLAAPDFEVESFLNEHAQFQTLSEMRRSIMNWELKLHKELVDTVNENYPEFLGSAESLDETLTHLEAVRLEVLKFRSDTVRTQTDLSTVVRELEQSIRRKRKLAQDELQVRQILRYLDTLDILDEQLCRPLGELDVDDYEEWSKMYVSAVQLQKRHLDSRLVQNSAKRLHSVRDGLLAVYSDIECDDKFRLAQAKSWILHN
ncbi:hypothetical protein B9G98_04098 [Wickerhamiella sorbophila]|uniref:Conserved oligomeric Golgi complex subunit 2 n=1 Tax=Wickerhamiella sorbophila TaxID=45607 RepID=A0A2T0FNB0_9ASCO|nr:hypothetical protein B9G98_04098 [Wickerhamiella sorbophila]PRT56478.1 hypothetical protein B9G98_04098 [Wickerhamiella sorbophila]